MDAQNATEADQSKPATAPRRRASDADSRRPPKVADRRSSASPETKSAKGVVEPQLDKPEAGETDADERDSDAETIVLPGKDGHSPSKIRKMKQEDKHDHDGGKSVKAPTGNGTDKPNADHKSTDGTKRRRLSASASVDKSQLTRTKDGSSGLSSAPASPPRENRALHRRRRSNASPHRSSDSEAAVGRGKLSHDRLKSGDRQPSAKRKALRTDSDDEDDHRKSRRQRTTSISHETARSHRERPTESRNRSNSPPTRLHRRSASTQLAPSSSGGLSQKKRRLPPPLQSTEHQSDDSDRSGSPLPRSSKLRSLATPATADSNVSPAKIIPHKKHLDAHGQTFLARACARGEYDAVKKRLGERPEDINVADYAGNTPLQIAAINGCEDIVKLLIDAGCNMDCVNYDKDTPLLDAVDNGHLEVVKLLLDAGVNPRKANVSGQEPIDRITDETENADGIRTLLIEARKRAGERRRTSEDRHSHADYYDARDSHAPDSPRHSPAMAQAGATGRRSGTVRATKTRNDLLYMPLDDKTLRQAAGRGDEETVARILQVKEGCNDPESMVAAARGGHDLVIQLLLGLGSANPDPGPVPSLQPEFATPILAAIGQENIKVVELLLEQGGFDPTRRFKGETYYEIARKRQGTNWKEEENLLKNAYDEYKRAHKDGKPGKSPGRRDREREREEKRSRRDDASRDEARTHKRSHSSPNREGDVRKKSSHRLSSPKERRKLEPGRHIKEDKPSSTQTSDRETSPAASHKATKSKHRDADAAVSSDGEALKPRRKLVSKGELRGERDKHRRSSMASNASSLKEPSSPQDSRNDEATSDKTKMSEKYHDRTKALKREETKDSSAPGGDSHAKRHRSSVTPDGGNHWEKDEGAIPQKRRRIDADEQAKRPKAPTSPETRHSKLNASRDGSKPSGKASRKSIEDETARDAKDSDPKRDRVRKETGRLNASEPAVRVKSEEDDVQMPDVESVDASAVREQDKRKKRQAEQEGAKEEEERQRAAEAKREEEHKRQEAKKEEERKQIEAEEKRKREEADEAKRREAAEKARLEKEEQRLEEEKRKKEEEQERQRQEAERKRQEEEKKRLEEARKRREEEERARLEQLEREAAEAARRKREEDQRKERERRERAQREELERKRAAREAEQRRVREEQEKARLDKLPPLMRWLDLHPNPKTRAVAKRFSQVQGCRYDTIDSATNGTAEGREEWVLNTAVALLLGEKDLTLSRYSAWDHVPVSTLAKETLWRTEWRQYSLASQQYFDLGREVPGLYPKDPLELTAAEKEELKQSAWERFRDMPMFFVKVSELLYTVPHISHLNGVTIGVGYRELQEPETSSTGFRVVSKQFRYLAKHLSDPDMERYHGRAPRYRWYLNGSFVEEDLPKQAITSHLPFNERPVPRRGLLAVNPNDPDYLKICREQGIAPLIKGQPSPTLTNGTREDSVRGGWSQKVNGINGSHGAVSSPEDQAKARQPLNGVNGIRQEISHEP